MKFAVDPQTKVSLLAVCHSNGSNRNGDGQRILNMSITHDEVNRTSLESSHGVANVTFARTSYTRGKIHE